MTSTKVVEKPLTPRVAADKLSKTYPGVTAKLVRQLCEQRRIDAVKFGNRTWLISRESLADFVARGGLLKPPAQPVNSDKPGKPDTKVA